MSKSKPSRPVELLSGGNPRIAKADGDAPVQAYLAALPGWKRDVGRRLDAIVTRSVPGVRKAVKWNSPFYGAGAEGWFLGLHAFTHYLKLAFLRGAQLSPLPPGASKSADTRYLDIREGDELDEPQITKWVKQAASLPGWNPPSSAAKEKLVDKSNTKSKLAPQDRDSAGRLIDVRIEELGDWRGETLARVRQVIRKADPSVVEEWKWNIPVWSHDGILCTGETYKSAVKLTFAKGASLEDPRKLFNSSLTGNTRRAIDIHEGEKLNEAALQALIREAVALNIRGKSKPKPAAKAAAKAKVKVKVKVKAKSAGAASKKRK